MSLLQLRRPSWLFKRRRVTAASVRAAARGGGDERQAACGGGRCAAAGGVRAAVEMKFEQALAMERFIYCYVSLI